MSADEGEIPKWLSPSPPPAGGEFDKWFENQPRRTSFSQCSSGVGHSPESQVALEWSIASPNEQISQYQSPAHPFVPEISNALGPNSSFSEPPMAFGDRHTLTSRPIFDPVPMALRATRGDENPASVACVDPQYETRVLDQSRMVRILNPLDLVRFFTGGWDNNPTSAGLRTRRVHAEKRDC
jgi:hypothetical protein